MSVCPPLLAKWTVSQVSRKENSEELTSRPPTRIRAPLKTLLIVECETKLSYSCRVHPGGVCRSLNARCLQTWYSRGHDRDSSGTMTYGVPAALAISPWLLTQCKDQPYEQHSTSLSPTAYLCIPLQAKLPPGANRILFVKNLNYQITGEDLYDLFGRYGSIRQIRIGNEPKSKGTAFVVYDDVMDVRGLPSSR